MKKILFLTTVLLVSVFAGCNKNEYDPNEEFTHTITARIADYGTKATMYGNTVNWEKGDQIALFANDGRKFLFKLKDGAEGKPVAEFETAENVEGITFAAALYPYYEDAVYSEGKISFASEKTTVWKEGVNKAPMAAVLTDQNNINFRNAGAVIALTVNNIPAGYDKIKLLSGTAVNGAAEISFTEDGPECRFISDSEENRTAVITFDKSVANANKVFYFPLGVFSKATEFSVKISASSTELTVLNNKIMNNAVRNSRYYKTISFDSKGDLPVEADAEEINAKIADGLANFILPSSCTSVEITTGTTEELQIAVTSTNNLFTLSGDDAKCKINLCTPAETHNLELDLPNASVELKPDAGVATYNTITATTADNTLVIPFGVTVNNLIIKGGSVRVFGKVINITNSKIAGKVKVYLEDGGEIPADLENSKFEVIDYANDSKYPKTGEELFKAVEAAAAGDVVLLGGDVKLNDILVINKAITLDGGNHTIYSTAGRCINVSGVAGEVTIKNINIVASGERGINIIQNSKKVNVENVKLSAANYAVNVAASAPNATVVINNSSLTGLNTVNIASPETEITINDSHLLCNDMTSAENYAAISMNNDAPRSVVEVNGGSITLKGDSYTYTVVDGRISLNGTKGDTDRGVGINYIIDSIYGDGYYLSFPTLESAINYVKNGETIQLVNDVTIMSAIDIPADKSFTLDLNDHTISLDAANNATSVTDLNNYGNLSIKNGTISAANKLLTRRCIYNRAGGKMQIENMKFIQKYERKGAAINNEAGGIMTISNTEVDAVYYSIWSDGKGTVTTVESGTFSSMNNVDIKDTWAYNTLVGNGAALYVNGGTFTGNHGVITVQGKNSVAVLNDGIFYCTAEYTGNSDWTLYTDGGNNEGDPLIKYNSQNCTVSSNNPGGTIYGNAIAF